MINKNFHNYKDAKGDVGINFYKIDNYDDLMSGVAHVFYAVAKNMENAGIPPEDVQHFLEPLVAVSKAAAVQYHKLALEGKVPATAQPNDNSGTVEFRL